MIINVFLAANQNIRMIYEEACDWSNDAKNSALKSHECYILKYIQIEPVILLFLLYFGSNKCRLGVQKRLFELLFKYV